MKKLDAPLYNAIKKYADKKTARFHMPGHKGRGRGIYKSARYDVTELDFSDDLLHSEGVIKDCEERFSKIYAVENAFMFTTGATGGIFAILYAVKCRTNKIILSKNTHKSVFNAMSVLGLEPCFVEPNYRDGIPQPITPIEVQKAIETYPDAGAVLITSPDYFGNVCDCKGIKEVVGERILVSDSAHGAHFVYTSDLTNRAEIICDCTVLSLHKTLPCYTGSAIVACRDDFKIDVSRGRRLFHTTSPQYLAMVSMDYSRAKMELFGRHGYRKIYEKLQKIPFNKLDNYDYTKLVLRGGKDLEKALKANGIYPECVCGDWVILILAVGDEKRLNKIYRISKIFGEKKDSEYETAPRLERVYTFSECGKIPTEKVALINTEGRVLAEEVGVYPPGVPQFIRGERISQECKDFMIEHKKTLFGVDSDEVLVLR